MTNEKLNLYCATTVWLIVLCHCTMTNENLNLYYATTVQVLVLCHCTMTKTIYWYYVENLNPITVYFQLYCAHYPSGLYLYGVASRIVLH